MKIMLLFSSVLFVFFLSSCENGKEKKPTAQEQKLVQTYAALSLLNESFPPTMNPDSTKLYRQQVDSILAAHGFTKEEFQSDFENLIKSPERFQVIIEAMVKSVQRATRP